MNLRTHLHADIPKLKPFQIKQLKAAFLAQLIWQCSGHWNTLTSTWPSTCNVRFSKHQLLQIHIERQENRGVLWLGIAVFSTLPTLPACSGRTETDAWHCNILKRVINYDLAFLNERMHVGFARSPDSKLLLRIRAWKIKVPEFGNTLLSRKCHRRNARVKCGCLKK